MPEQTRGPETVVAVVDVSVRGGETVVAVDVSVVAVGLDEPAELGGLGVDRSPGVPRYVNPGVGSVAVIPFD